jgi:hypothetical protein
MPEGQMSGFCSWTAAAASIIVLGNWILCFMVSAAYTQL